MIEELTTIMPDNEIRKSFGLRIKELRKQKNGLKKSWRQNWMHVSRS
jgi:hypothetical protein